MIYDDSAPVPREGHGLTVLTVTVVLVLVKFKYFWPHVVTLTILML